MVKVSVNLEDRDAQMIEQLASSNNEGSKSDIIRAAIHEYCENRATRVAEYECIARLQHHHGPTQ